VSEGSQSGRCNGWPANPLFRPHRDRRARCYRHLAATPYEGREGQELCLYNRKTKRVEVQELAEPVVKQALVVKDVWWRAEDIGGKGIMDNSEVTLMLGGDGKIGGKSGCNGYSANYQLTGDVLKVFPPMIGTRMMCPPALMNQEEAYRSLLETAQSVSVTPEGALVITSAGGATSRFMRK
jgi:heat shock protein HslJ